MLHDEAALFCQVASDPTAWRILSDVDGEAVVRLRYSRARARELAWAHTMETHGSLPCSTAAGQPIPGLVLDLDASVVTCHSPGEGIGDPYLEDVWLSPVVLLRRRPA